MRFGFRESRNPNEGGDDKQKLFSIILYPLTLALSRREREIFFKPAPIHRLRASLIAIKTGA
jgi:hypothetical protein